MFFLLDTMLTLWLIKWCLVCVYTENSFECGFCWCRIVLLGWIWPASWFLSIPDIVNDFIHIFNIFMWTLYRIILHIASFYLHAVLHVFVMLTYCALTFYTMAAFNIVRKIQRSRVLWYWDLLSWVLYCAIKRWTVGLMYSSGAIRYWHSQIKQAKLW